ncbi:ExeA family protein [Ruegeria sp. Alg231-54]|uniref:ExeA family protein n=1 Tax=Ruegeria sp. Alg231-54 TaxID=1922221 RepID=UPI000D5573E0|nr:AAA family ATPase [Ruegeria sp. Alg231-54]
MSNDLYVEHFGLTERPFTLLPDPGFLFWSKVHKRAFMVLEFGILSRAPITLITGEIGSGKTTLIQKLLSQMDDNITTGLISNAHRGRGEMLQWVLNALDVPVNPRVPYVQLFQTLLDFLIAEYAAGRRVALIFDEAQNLSREGLEELRMLTNINSNKDELVQLILVGQPELRDMVLDPNMRQLAQRVAASFHLPGMDRKTVTDYIAHRLQVAGGTGEEFTPGACAMVYETTAGIPRLVNQLCEFGLLYAWSDDSMTVSERIVQNVLDDDVFFGALSTPDCGEKKKLQVLTLNQEERILPKEKAG